MSAGIPNWGKLHSMGKLPEDQKHQIPFLGDVQEIEAEKADLEKKNQTLRGQVTKLKKEVADLQKSQTSVKSEEKKDSK